MVSFEYSGAALLLFLASVAVWMMGARSLNLSNAKRTIFVLALVAALGLAIAALVTASEWTEYAAAAVTALLPLFPLYLIYHAQQSNQPPALKVGDAILDFTAPDENGDDFTLSSLAGKSYILKFYRGQWCPYCIGELLEWDKMASDLKALGIQQMVYISTDSPADIRKGKPKHNAEGFQLSDPDLKVAELYNIVNHGKNIMPPNVKAPGMPIPTTVLVDVNGIVRWIDQASDYQVRAGRERVLGVVRSLEL